MKTTFLCLGLLLTPTLLHSQVAEDWVRTFEGNIAAVPFNMVIDNLGNVYITGATVGDSMFTGNDYTTIKYSPSGVLQWEANYNGTANNHDEASAITVDQSGNVYVTGHSYGDIGGFDSDRDYLTIKYDSAGNGSWVRRYNGNSAFINIRTDEPTDITVDTGGNVYVTGTSAPDSGATQNCLTLKYDASGTLQWEARYDQSGVGVALKVDASGNVHVAGSGPGLIAGIDYVTIKYDSSGQELWAKRYNLTGNEFNLPTAMVIDETGNVYVTGSSEGSYGYLTVKYNASGDFLWAATYSEYSTIDKAKDIVVDGLGNVYVTGYSGNSGGNTTDYVTIKYNSDGAEQWVARYAGVGTTMGSSGANAIALDDIGNVYVTGRVEVDFLQGNAYDYATIKYDNDGNEQWTVSYDGTGGQVDEAISISVDQSENVYITGRSMQPNGSEAFVTIKYSQNPTSVNESSSETPENYLLYQNYPNPFNPTTTIAFAVPRRSGASLKVFDLLGREIETLFSGQLEAGTFLVQWNAQRSSSGVYFYRLQTGGYVETKRMLLLK